uniref:Uncharacterized protein n=1 Tax=Ditylenchus dipsaci TaxID=166011 RepID=A0A915EPZ5_9BILA
MKPIIHAFCICALKAFCVLLAFALNILVRLDRGCCYYSQLVVMPPESRNSMAHSDCNWRKKSTASENQVFDAKDNKSSATIVNGVTLLVLPITCSKEIKSMDAQHGMTRSRRLISKLIALCLAVTELGYNQSSLIWMQTRTMSLSMMVSVVTEARSINPLSKTFVRIYLFFHFVVVQQMFLVLQSIEIKNREVVHKVLPRFNHKV